MSLSPGGTRPNASFAPVGNRRNSPFFLLAMAIYIAMLRGINVGGHKTVKMEPLRASFACLNFTGIQTFLQSGNVVFGTNKSETGLAATIERKILADFGFSVPVMLKTAKNLAAIIENNPFPKDPSIDPAKLHVTFLSTAPPNDATGQLKPLAAARERFQVLGREIYLYCPDGYGRTKLTNNAIEKKLSRSATTRNWNTVKALLAMTTAAGL